MAACAQLEDYDQGEWSTRESKPAEAQPAEAAQPASGEATAVEAAAVSTPVEVPANDLEYRQTKQAIPTGKASTSALLLTKSLPAEVLKDEEFEYRLTVENLTGEALDNVFVEERLPTALRALDSDPKLMSNEGGKLLWNLGTLAAKESRTIRVRSVATADGLAESFATASYDKALKGEVRIVSPVLALALTAPALAAPGDPIELTMSLSNTGTGTARNVSVTATLPDGLETMDGKQQATLTVASLEAGTSRELVLQTKATRAGSFTPSIEASGARGAAVSASAPAIRVEDTRLELGTNGPSKFFLGTPGKVEYTVKNVGQALAKDVQLRQPLPKGVELVRASMPAEQADGVCSWNLGDLASGESKTVTVHLMAAEAGTMNLAASAKASKGPQVDGSVTAAIEGLAALNLAIEDLQDPVPVGESVTYHIKVHNQGTAPAEGITIEVTLDEGMQLVRAAGPTNGRAEENKILFKPLDTLEPDATATWRLVIQSKKVGDLRLGASLTSSRLQRPVIVTESTQFYE